MNSSSNTPQTASMSLTASIEKKAKRRAKAKLGFIIHLVVFGAVFSINAFEGFFAGNLFATMAGFLGWGIGLFFHGFAVFTKPALINQLTSNELEQLHVEAAQLSARAPNDTVR